MAPRKQMSTQQKKEKQKLPIKQAHTTKTAPRRSYRIQALEYAKAEQTSKFLGLPAEIRLRIFSYAAVTTKRPYMIGRCQESQGSTSGSPRDMYIVKKYKPKRDETRNRPIQPGFTRVCRLFRKEALPLWYSMNKFWLIHNEFEPGYSPHREYRREGEKPRAFEIWISQTPREYFGWMQHVSLCGCASWPSRFMITIDLKSRQCTGARHYSQYGEEMPFYRGNPVEATNKAIASRADGDALDVLRAVLGEWSSIFVIPEEQPSAPPGFRKDEPACGWEYDW